MEKVLLMRLSMLTHEIKKMSDSFLTLTFKESVEISKAEVVRAKLKKLLEILNNDLNNYFTMVNTPSPDEVSMISEIQLSAEQNLAELEVKLDNFEGTSSNGVQATTVGLLPELSLSEFEGNILYWQQFWDQFCSNIDSKNIAEVDKLLYLKDSIKGEAKTVIDGLEITNNNYQIAVKALKDRYGKSSNLIDAHYAALFKVPIADKTISMCRKTLNDIEGIIL